MRMAIMQPYLFPYLGYFQLISAVDNFIIHDDVQYIKGGWINNNRILLNEKYSNIVIPVRRDSAIKKINERFYVDESLKFKTKILRQIENSYRKAPFFDEILPFITKTLSFEELNVSKFNTWCLSQVCSLLQIKSRFSLSSELIKEDGIYGEERVIKINKVMGSKMYINPAGGVELYKRASFHKSNVELKFLITEDYFYNQLIKCFVPNLSIIDLLMFNSLESVNKLLNKYHLE